VKITSYVTKLSSLKIIIYIYITNLLVTTSNSLFQEYKTSNEKRGNFLGKHIIPEQLAYVDVVESESGIV
jgi:hypothetical protein